MASTPRELIVSAARGDQPLDLVVRNVDLVNVFTAEVYRADLGIKGDRYAAVARYEDGRPQFELQGFCEIDGTDKVAMPGFVDSHVHVESMMVPPDQFAKAVLRNGTTAATIDPHEIANVLGVDGVRYMVEASQGLPVRIWTTVPSCVPPVPGLETSGAEFGPEEVDLLLQLPGVVGIAEVMDYPGVINHHARMAGIVQVGLNRGVVNEGHAPRVSGRWLQAYLAAGVNSDHESRWWEEILEKLRAGMVIHIRDSSFGHYVGEAARAWEQVPHAINLTMCTDDIEPDDVLKRGHMNRVVRLAIEAGIPAPLAVRYATLNGALRYRSYDLGAIGAGYLADLVLVDSLETMQVREVYVEGRHVVSDGEVIVPIASTVAPPMQNTMRLPELTETSFQIRAPIHQGEIEMTTVEFGERGMTVAGRLRASVRDGVVGPLPPDYCYISVTGRHGQGRPPFVGVLKGLGLRSGAHGTTVAHDSHNLVIAGTSAADMLLVARTLAQQGGGFCLAKDGAVLATVPLPLAGLMTPEPVELVGPRVDFYNQQATALGINPGARSPILSLAGMALVVIPEVKISDLGLVHVTSQQLLPLFPAA
ncbi:MAG: adenine deaminase [Chloroflexi bacterium]|nr:adenine deaminase [Chloroflexota bacterium]